MNCVDLLRIISRLAKNIFRGFCIEKAKKDINIMRVNPMKDMSYTKKMLMQVSIFMNKIRMNFN